ncbi:MAG: hydrolase [Kiritimatiellia bacterium]
MAATNECCPRFDPAPWQERWMAMDGKRFVKDRVRSFLRIPLNFGGVMARNMEIIQKAGAEKPDMIVLSDENSPWGSDVYLEVAKDVPGAAMASIPGTFLAQAYEGPYRNIPKWIADVKRRVADKGKTLKRLLFFYTTCPTCAKKYGKNYVVLFAQT